MASKKRRERAKLKARKERMELKALGLRPVEVHYRMNNLFKTGMKIIPKNPSRDNYRKNGRNFTVTNKGKSWKRWSQATELAVKTGLISIHTV